jgi:riboflavin transporter FmnP
MTAAKHRRTLNLVYAAMCLALCQILPFLTGQIPQIAQLFSPMHIPVLLAGFLCGPWWAMAVGFIAPPLRHVLFHIPAYPTFVAMAFELAAYGLITGFLYRRLPRRTPYIYVTLVAAMLLGRVVSGIANVVLYGLGAREGTYTMAMFLSAHFIKAWPALLLHIVLIPILVLALQRAGIIEK